MELEAVGAAVAENDVVSAGTGMKLSVARDELVAKLGLVARAVSTRGTVQVLSGILLSAVGDELVIAHPTDELSHPQLAAVVSGPALYLLAHVALRLRITQKVSGRRLAGAIACLAVGVIGTSAPALVVCVRTTSMPMRELASSFTAPRPG